MHHNLIQLKKIDSTHKYAIDKIENGNAEECVIVAEEQLNGIGRGNRQWISEKGNLFVSLIRKSSNRLVFGQLSLCIACAVRESMENYLQSEYLKLHWPNDIYYKNKKISGILLTVIDEYVIISIGVNINAAPMVPRVGCVKDFAGLTDDVPPMDVLHIILMNIDKWISFLDIRSFSCIKDYWLRNINDIKCNVIIKNGEDFLDGYFSDIDDLGRIVIERDSKKLFVCTGEIFLNEQGITVNHE